MGSTIKMQQNKRIPHSFGKEQGIPSKPKDGDSNKRTPIRRFLDDCFLNNVQKIVPNREFQRTHSFNSCRRRIKPGCTPMGTEHHEASTESTGWRADYQKKHIRVKNRRLQLNSSKYKHAYFDDNREADSRGILCDTSDNRLSSCDKEPSAGRAVALSRPQERNKESPLPKRRKETLSSPPEIRRNAELQKYWLKRYLLFSKFDQGIRLDEESWYSVTPESVAKQAAERCRCDVIVDAFCGAGGNAIQFAMTCNRVIAIDIDPKKIDIAYHNAQIYGVAHKILFIVGDFLQLTDSLKADAVFLSPPWGGPGYLLEPVYDLEKDLQPVPVSQLLDASRKISRNIAAFLPRNCNTFPLIKEAGIGGRVEIEKNFLNNKVIAITAYYNNLIKNK